ncbi:phosphotransferase family protein [Kitasatospora phosalacinea]|uniref:phosphotransferase family protein n=1 Tax=Kitasatospora phosalacinea TaxID=2065 RepID=UPI00068E5D14|nr:phosphotransferase [Kitasatospora phosalacinea]
MDVAHPIPAVLLAGACAAAGRPSAGAELIRAGENALRRLHRLPPPRAPLPALDPFVRLPDRIDAAGLDEPHRRRLRARLAELRTAWRELALAARDPRVVHGDAWSGNLAVTATTAHLLDFERTALGPVEWDLTTTAVGHHTFGTVPPETYAAFCAAYGAHVTESPAYPLLRDLRELRLTCYALQQSGTDPRHRPEARYRLACLLGEHGSRPWGWTPLD